MAIKIGINSFGRIGRVEINCRSNRSYARVSSKGIEANSSKDNESSESSDSGSDDSSGGDDDDSSHSVAIALEINRNDQLEMKPTAKDLMFESFLDELAKLPLSILHGIVTAITIAVLLKLLGLTY